VKTTLPVGIPAPGDTGAMVAVYVTISPTTGVGSLVEMPVVVDASEIVT
jgi:hypothetical protein